MILHVGSSDELCGQLFGAFATALGRAMEFVGLRIDVCRTRFTS